MKKAMTNHLITISVFSAAGVLGGLIKIPSPVGSIALDSLPGFFAAGFFNPLVGAFVGAIGHIGSAATAGLPLGVLHIIVSLCMFAWCGGFGWLIRKINKGWAVWLSSSLAIIANGVVTPIILIPFGLPSGTAYAIMPFVSVAAGLNIIIASLAIKGLSAAKIKGI